ncbi:MAG: barstar family protein [Tissierellia bacterium]|nr:barstar family protein [Tissierellia bacterium]
MGYRQIILKGDEILTKEDLHDVLEKAYGFGDYYGRNLDAFEDLMNTYDEIILLEIQQEEKLQKNLGEYYDSLWDIFKESINPVYRRIN